ncbi:MAG TPA: 4-aminobutyrate--2-oxoglutarate transaminase [Acidimicrobiales bacterium]|nr:4-aminobutyrate--2-oxoglutarate transaminase [Acidimicrobiales bacterium]
MEISGVAQRRELVTDIPGPRSRELMVRRKLAVPPGVSGMMPVFAARAGGGVLVDVDGNSFIDLGAGIAVLSVGSSAELVSAAVASQAARFTHTCFQVTPYEGYVELAERLNSLVPGDLERRTFFVNSGAEALENAVKIARSVTGRQAVVVFEHAFHGRTLLTMTMTAKAMPYKTTFGPLAPEVYRLPFSYPYRCPVGAPPDECGTACAEAAITLMDRQIGGDQIAALVVEPVLGEAGVVIPAQGFLPALAEYCAANGIVFVADEVQAGFARTGRWFSSEHWGLVPDIVTTAKGLGGGMPIGGVTARADVIDQVHTGGLGGTFGGNPVCCAAALAAIAEVERGGLIERAERMGEIFTQRLRPLLEEVDAVGDVRVIGGMAAVELVSDRARKTPDPAAAAKVLGRCHAEGVIVLKAGTYDNVVRLLPPLVIGEDLLNEGLEIFEKALRSL